MARFSFAHEAHIAMASLEAAGIPAFLADEHTINMQWLYSNALGGVRLQVPNEWVEQAKAVLAQDWSAEVEALFPQQELCCSQCGGCELVRHTKGKKPALLVFLLLGFPLFFYQHGYRCKSCGGFTPADAIEPSENQ